MSGQQRGGLKYKTLFVGFFVGVGSTIGLDYVLSAMESKDNSVEHPAFPTVGTYEASTNSQDILENGRANRDRGAQSLQHRLSDMAAMSPLQRNKVLLDLVSSADKAQILSLLQQTKQLKLTPVVQSQVQAVLLQGLVRIDSDSALSHAKQINDQYSSYLISAVFGEWVHIDLQDAILKATTLVGDERTAALDGLLQETSDLSAEERLEIGRQVGNEQYALNAINLERLGKASEDPATLWNELVDDAQHDPEQLGVLTHIAQLWVSKQGPSVLDQIVSSLDNRISSAAILTSVLRRLAQTDPQEAFRYSLNLDGYHYRDVKFEVLHVWVRTDPHSALSSISDVGSEGLRFLLHEQLVQTWASFNPTELLENLHALPEDLVNEATLAAVGMIAGNAPRDAAGLVSEMDDDHLKFRAARSVIGRWLIRDVDAVFDWVVHDTGLEPLRSQLITNVLARIAESDPEYAMKLALEQPIPTGGKGAEAVVVQQIAVRDVDKALEYVVQVRDGPTKTAAYRSVGTQLVRRGDTGMAMELVEQIPDYAKDSYTRQVFGSWSAVDPVGLYHALGEMPSTTLASRAALVLLLNDPRGESLNSSQTDNAKEYLLESDSRQLERLRAKVPLIPLLR